MSDGLIERLKAKVTDVENARGPAKHILNDRLADLGQVTWDHMDEIIAGLSALKTLRGIEWLIINGYDPWLYIDDNGEYVCSMTKNYYGETLSLAVDAAVGANEKGEK
jgi:hypothetical protein